MGSKFDKKAGGKVAVLSMPEGRKDADPTRVWVTGILSKYKNISDSDDSMTITMTDVQLRSLQISCGTVLKVH